MNYSQNLKNQLFSIIHQMSQRPEPFVSSPKTDFSRNRKLNFEIMIKLILSMEAGSVRRELLRFFNFSSDTASPSAFIQQRKKISASAFEYLLHSFRPSFPKKSYKGYHPVACDDSVVTIPLECKPQNDAYQYIRLREGQKPYHQLHVTVLHDILNDCYLDAFIEPRKGHDERKALNSLIEKKNFSQKTIFIADRGFEGYALMAQIIQSGMFFLIRVKDGRSGGLIKGFSLPKSGEYDKTFTYTYTSSRSSMVMEHPDIYKSIHYTSSPYFLNPQRAFYKMTLRVVRIKLNSNEYECLITNLPQEEFSVDDLKKLYGMRWGVETSFCSLKYSTGMLYFHSKKVEFIVQEIWAHLLMYNFYSAITSQIRLTSNGKKYRYKPNFTDAVHICRYFLKVCNDETPPDIETLLLKGMLPVRPDRQFPRKKRNIPAIGFHYRVI